MRWFNQKWRGRFIESAQHFSQWSKDPTTKVGALLADNEKRVISIGYNGFPRGFPDLQNHLEDRELKNKFSIHAEVNAILNCPQSTKGLHLFSTRHPCARCALEIVQTGIASVYCLEPEGEFAERWSSEISLARVILRNSGVALNLIDMSGADMSSKEH